jgi:peptide/nickel transport system substrate-binding protein
MFRRLCIVLAAAALVAAACSSSSPTKKIVLAEWQYPDTVNPYFAQAETDIEVSDSMFLSLVDVTNDLRTVPDLVTTVPSLANGGVKMVGAGMDVTWTLRSGMQWSDGNAINCADLTATWKWVMDPDNTGLAGGTVGWEDISSIDGGTGLTCVMHFSKVYEGFLYLVAPLLPAKYIQSVPVKDAPTKLYPLSDLKSGVYDGPYIPTSAAQDSQITTVANGKWSTISGHAPFVDQVIWKYYADAATMLQGYKAGEYDIAQDLNDADIPSLAGIDTNQQVIHDSLTYELHAFNNKSLQAKFGDDYKTIIKAVKLATDRQAIATGPLGGNVSVTNNFVSALTWYYKVEGGSTSADPAAATAALTAAGWTLGSDGYLAKAGKTLELQYCTSTRQVRQDTLKLVATQLKAIGIKATVNIVPAQPDLFGAWNDVKDDTKCNMQHGNFDVAEFAYVSPLDPLGGYNVYTTQGIPDNAPHNGQNITRTSIKALDDAYNAVKGSVDPTVVKAAMATIQDIYASDQNTYELPLYARKDVWLVNPRIHGFTGNPTTSAGPWNIGDWTAD